MPSVWGHCKDRSPLWGGHLLQMQSLLQVKKIILYLHQRFPCLCFRGESQREKQIVGARRWERALSTNQSKNIALVVVWRNVSGR